MQRVRIGLTGLACVFVLVLLAAAFFGLARSQDDAGTGPGSAIDRAQSNGATQPKEPLAELGVTPGGGVDRPKDAQQQPDPSSSRPR